MVRVIAGVIVVVVNVTTPVRDDVEKLSSAFSEIVPLLVPQLSGALSQLTLDDMIHSVFDVTATDTDVCAALATLHVDLSRVSAAVSPGWTMLVVHVEIGAPEVVANLTLPVR